jgi:hypothetical protein
LHLGLCDKRLANNCLSLSVSTSKKTHCLSTTWTNCLLAIRDIVTAYSENQTKHVKYCKGKMRRKTGPFGTA